MKNTTLKNELVMVTATLDRMMRGTHYGYILELQVKRQTEIGLHDFEEDWGLQDVMNERCIDFVTDNRATVRNLVLRMLEEGNHSARECECRLLANYLIALDWLVGWDVG